MRSFKLFCTVIFFFGTQLLISAPAPPPGGGGGTPGCWPPPCVPIDGGITFLIIAGAAYGAKKLADSRKKSNFQS